MNGLTEVQRKCIFVGCNQTANDLGVKADDYRHKIMSEELGISSLTQCNRTGDFDKLMQRIWSDRGEYSRALEYVGGDIKRLRHLATEAALAIVQQNRAWPGGVAPAACRYIAGVMVQMRMSFKTVDSLAIKLQRDDGWDDFTDLQLKKVVSALQTHIRRHR